MAFLAGHRIHVVRGGTKDYERYVEDILVNILKAVSHTGPITVGVSGGSMPNTLCPIFKRLDAKWAERMVIFPADERLVPLDHDDSNVGTYLKQLPGSFESRFLKVQHIADARQSASAFEESLRSTGVSVGSAGFPQFDVLFLGLGPDGHTCSLFPTHHLLYEDTKWVAPIEDSPKPPPRRVTITLPVIRAAKHVLFLVTGESKAQVVKEMLVDEAEKYPPVLIRPAEGLEVEWVLDEAAGGEVQQG